MKMVRYEAENPTVLEVIDLAERVLKLSGRLDTRAHNLVYKTTTVLMVGKTFLRSYPEGLLEIFRKNYGPDKDGLTCWGHVLQRHKDEPTIYNPEIMDRLVVQLRRVLILESLANL